MNKRIRKKYNRRQAKAIADLIYNECNGPYPIIIQNGQAFILDMLDISVLNSDIGVSYMMCPETVVMTPRTPEYLIHAVLRNGIIMHTRNKHYPKR